MAWQNTDFTYRPSNFFVAHSQSLSQLLDVIVAEAHSATEPQACIDYLELTHILTDLLEQAQAFSILGPEQLRGRWQEVHIFDGKVQAVQEAVVDWGMRLQQSTTMPTAMATTQMMVEGVASSKKRARSGTLEMETAGALKRFRSEDGDRGMVSDAVTNLVAIRSPRPSLERTTTPWWTEPLYD